MTEAIQQIATINRHERKIRRGIFSNEKTIEPEFKIFKEMAQGLDEKIGEATIKWFNFFSGEENKQKAVLNLAKKLLTGDKKATEGFLANFFETVGGKDTVNAQKSGEKAAKYVELVKKTFSGQAGKDDIEDIGSMLKEMSLPDWVKARFRVWLINAYTAEGDVSESMVMHDEPGTAESKTPNRPKKPKKIKGGENNFKRWFRGERIFALRVGAVGFQVIITVCLGVTAYLATSRARVYPEPQEGQKAPEVTNFDSSGRQERYLKFENPNSETRASRWASGNWEEYTTQDLIDNLDPATSYDGIDAFVEFCPGGPIACFTDPARIPPDGRPVVQELLGLTPTEHEDYYNKRNKPTEEQQKTIRDRLHQKYNAIYPWLAPLFENSPTSLDFLDQSDWEKWWEDYHPQSSDIHSTRERVQAEGPNWKNPSRGQKSTASINRGRGFGSTKGFS